jgi:hypothetical protein
MGASLALSSAISGADLQSMPDANTLRRAAATAAPVDTVLAPDFTQAKPLCLRGGEFAGAGEPNIFFVSSLP